MRARIGRETKPGKPFTQHEIALRVKVMEILRNEKRITRYRLFKMTGVQSVTWIMRNKDLPIWEVDDYTIAISEHVAPETVRAKRVRLKGEPLLRKVETNGIGGSWVLQ